MQTTSFMLTQFLSGTIFTSCFVSSLFFYSFWRKSGDRFFSIFSFAFLLFGIERVLLATIAVVEESRVPVYTVRLLGFVLILYAIWGKNRERPAR